MLDRVINGVSSIGDNVGEYIESINRKRKMYKSEMQIGDRQLTVAENSHLVMKDERLYIKEIKVVIADEYFVITYDNGEVIHYDYYGQAYLSLDPKSRIYNFRLSRYDITNII